MANSNPINKPINKRENKNFVINNRFFLNNYAKKNSDILGQGIIVINLLLLKNNILDAHDLSDYLTENLQEQTVHRAISYIPKQNFWFKIISLKIRKKYQIDLQAEEHFKKKFLVIFIKDASIEHFSIYSLKPENSQQLENS